MGKARGFFRGKGGQGRNILGKSPVKGVRNFKDGLRFLPQPILWWFTKEDQRIRRVHAMVTETGHSMMPSGRAKSFF
jgi:hypothetical protein